MAKELSWQDLAGGDTEGDTNTGFIPGAEPKKRQRRPKGTTADVAITKAAIADILTVANLPIQISSYGRYALTKEEIDAMAEAWYRVIKQNPYVGKYLVSAGKLGVWGNLIFVHAQIVGKRFEAYSKEQAAMRRSARTGPVNGEAGRPMRSELLA